MATLWTGWRTTWRSVRRSSPSTWDQQRSSEAKATSTNALICRTNDSQTWTWTKLNVQITLLCLKVSNQTKIYIKRITIRTWKTLIYLRKQYFIFCSVYHLCGINLFFVVKSLKNEVLWTAALSFRELFHVRQQTHRCRVDCAEPQRQGGRHIRYVKYVHNSV